MTVRSKEQVIAAAASILERAGPSCSVSEMARRLKMSRREMYRYFRNASELKEAAISLSMQYIQEHVSPEFDGFGDSGVVLTEVLEMAAYLQERGLLESASEELRQRYLSLRLCTLKAILDRGRREGTFSFGDLDTATRLCLHVLDDHSRQFLAFHQAFPRAVASHAGIDVDARQRAFRHSFCAVVDMLMVAFRYVPDVEGDDRQTTARSVAH